VIEDGSAERLVPTPSQTAGPFVSIGTEWLADACLVASGSPGAYCLRTVAPGEVPTGDGTPQAPHIDVSIFARGLLQRLVTRIYFSDQEAANALDPVLASIGVPAAVSSLIALGGPEAYELDLRLQGDEETVFFVP
jgi:protocatechuate 3,4-dioxygenase alpha subunit